MDFAPTEAEQLVRDAAHELAKRVLSPVAAQLDREGRFPQAELAQLASAGLMGVNVPERYGGAAAGVVAYSLALQEIAAACASTAVTMAVTNMVAEVIARFGTEEQRQRYVPRLTSGEYVAGSFALSETGAGSDPGSMTTRAERDGDGWVLSGEKQWITSGDRAGVIVVWARTGGPGTRGISCFLVEPSTPGFSVTRHEDKLGLRASSTVSLGFDGCRLPASALLGAEGQGFKVAMMALDGGRIGIASQALGIAGAALRESVAYARQRVQFGRPIGEFQAIQWMIADSDTELSAARLLTLRAAWLKQQGQRFSSEAAMAKLHASEAAFRVCDRNLQIHGGAGYVRDFPAERHVRDVRVTRIYEGTSEIQRLVIARAALTE
ncbi:MAG TPA: acyl-CoA dehydrogenase family protein [Polyangiales bacterium]